jgi:pilus assembly protein CpaB
MIARRLITALLIAIAVSGGFTFWLSRGIRGARRAAPPTRQYVTTAQNMEAGETIRPANVVLRDWPSNTPLEGAFTKPEEVAGRTLLYPLAKGQPILERQLYTGTGVGLSMKIPDGMRAISLKSDQVVVVAGFLNPGTHIDVLVTYHTANLPDPVTSTVLQDAQIIAAGQKMQPDPDGKATTVDVVTLLVTPLDAEKVVLASAQGTVHFVLRNGSDHQHVVSLATHISDLGEGVVRPIKVTPRPQRIQVVLPQPFRIQVLRGDKMSVETFQ